MTLTTTNQSLFKEILLLSKNGNYTKAELLINSLNDNSAHWNFIYSIILKEKGWFDSSLTYLKKAITLSPENSIYVNELKILESRHHNYSNNYYRSTHRHHHSSCCCCCDCCDCDDCDCCFNLWCADSCCECMGGDLISCC